MPEFHIAVLGGDGIGPEVIAEGVRVLRAVEAGMSGTSFVLEDWPAGANEYLQNGDPLPATTMDACRRADAILLGAMGMPSVRWPNGTEMAPQLDLREQLELYAGVRPARLYNPAHSPLRGRETAPIDLVMFRENTEGMFASRKNSYDPGAGVVCDTLRISRHASERLFRAAFRMAASRRSQVTLIDKSNVLPSMAYFRSIFDQVSREFPSVRAEHVYVDAAALYLVRTPERFDVLVTENLFGDILSDLTAGLAGGMGMAPSGDIGDEHALFQPAHGSAPDIAGRGIANPLATILSVAMMLEWLDTPETVEGAARIRRSVELVCQDRHNATPDLGGKFTTSQMGDTVIAAL
ncbi:MAG: isocitrate/isopropylmalate dehydrogenase family protein [Bryobacteraceae bacterium]